MLLLLLVIGVAIGAVLTAMAHSGSSPTVVVIDHSGQNAGGGCLSAVAVLGAAVVLTVLFLTLAEAAAQ